MIKTDQKTMDNLFNKGIFYFKEKKYHEAKKYFQKFYKIYPSEKRTIFLLGACYFEIKNFDLSKEFLIKFLEYKPNHSTANYILGLIYKLKRDYENSILFFERAYRNDKNNLDIVSNFSINLIKTKMYDKAEKLLLESIENFKTHYILYNHLGYLYFETGQTQKCILYYNQALDIEKKNLEAYCNLGNAYLRNSELSSAKKIFERGLKIFPNNKDIQYSNSFLFFAKNEFKKGFKAFENRKIIRKLYYKFSNTLIKEWKGEDLNQKKILILSEQGIGDIIHFSRYIFALKKKYSVEIIFKTKNKILHLYKNCNFKVFDENYHVNNADYYQYLMSLPGIFLELFNKFESNFNFINPEQKLVNIWKKKLDTLKGYKIGLCWQGDPNYGRDFMRSIPLSNFEKLFSFSNVNFISFVKGYGSEQIKNFGYSERILDITNKIDNGKNAYEDTIAMLKNLDLLITVDTSLLHIASTMNVKTWLIIHHSPDWRWNLKQENFQWYKNLTIFKQKIKFSWMEAIDEMYLKLKDEFKLI